ncbi:hypothetical protein GH5_02742 [Leishmania sp. Ghana 2012 LV757]|uniref:hypothetical protein n=1 Tax=Leishmania sp. Ghana 2012 LV757 TaxID=2803181 RepID=UPI001B527AD0|nr:hypothetical protein GH5_02742 [Leishmania sp. Ghana 2012 LV757]
MTVSRQCVRISLFQCAPLSDASVHQAHQSSQADGKLEAKQRLFRSRLADYRGDVLIPLTSISSSPLPLTDKTPVNATLRQLLDGLEDRLSAYCVLHVPASRARRFVEEHQLAPSSMSLSPPAAESSAAVDMRLPSCANERQSRDSCTGEPLCLYDSAKFCCCASCSSAVLAEAAIVSRKAPAALSSPSAAAGVASTVASNAPWIRINQLQRMTARRSGSTSHTPSSSPSLQASSVLRASPHPVLSAEEWVRQQRHSADVFLTSSEAESIGAVAVDDDGAGGEVEGGACYAAFFSLAMLPAAERAKRLMRSLAQASVPAAATAVSPFPAVFTVRAHNHFLRMGLPLPSLEKDGSSKALSSPPTLREIIIDRLRLQRGVHVERLLDADSGAAVLPCEGAAVLLSAQVGGLEAECRVPPAAPNGRDEGFTQRLAPRSPSEAQQQLSSSSTRARVHDPGAETASDFLDHVVGLRAHGHADNYYYGADAYGWAEWRTLISPSAPPSESELRLAFTGSRNSSQASLYSSTPPSAASSAAASSAVSLSTENSSSRPRPLLQSEAMGAVLTAPPDGVVVAGSSPGMKPHLHTKSGADAEEQVNRQGKRVFSDQRGSPAFISIIDAEEETAPLSLVQDQLERVHDSLCDMNDVFLYEDEETVMDAEVADAWASGGGGGSQRRERRSSLVWSTPVARGSGAARMLSDTGFCATPLMYRTRTRLSVSPSTSPVAVPGEAETTERNERPTQRTIFVKSPSSAASSSRSFASGASAQEAEMTPPGSGWDEGVASADEVPGGVALDQVVRKGSDIGDAAVEGRDGHVAEQGTNKATDEALMSAASASAVSLASPSASSSSSVMSTTESRIPSAPTRSSVSSSICAGGDSPWAPLDEATSIVRREGAEASSREGQATPPPLLGRASSPALPLPQGCLRSPHPQKPRYAAALVHVDEVTTSIAPCSTLPPSSRSSEHELRSCLHSLNPLATQDGSEYACQRAPLAAAQISVGRWHGKSGEGTVRYAHDGCSSSERMSARVRGAITLDSSNSRPTAASVVAGVQTVTRLSPAVSADSSDGADSTVSTPSTTVAARPVHGRSPILFSPEEVSRMALEMMSSDTAQTRSPSMGHPLRRTADGSLDHACEGSEHTPGHYGYGDYIASYTLPDSDHWNDLDGNGEWGYISPHSSARCSRQATVAQSSRGVVLQPGSQSSQRLSAPSPVVATTAEEAEAGTVPLHRLRHTKRRRSFSLSASGLETWVQLSDEDIGSTERDAGDHMLVTQQEMPLYSRHSSSSAESGSRGSARTSVEESESDSEDVSM